MTFAEKLKSARKEAKMTQEALAEKLGVSRQAITKWETDRGLPDIENMMIISNLFGISVDEFLSQEINTVKKPGYLYESVTEYDIDGKKNFDMKLGGAHTIELCTAESEKIKIIVGSDTISDINTMIKVKLDDNKSCIDVDTKRNASLTEAEAKENVFIRVILPAQFVRDVEMEANCSQFLATGINCTKIEFDGRVRDVTLNELTARLEINCNLDMHIAANDINGCISLNQLSATSVITVPENACFKTLIKGIGNSVHYKKDGVSCDDFSDAESENIIELNGLKSELVIERTERTVR